MRTLSDIRTALPRMRPSVIAMVVEVKGSAPREVGAFMLVGRSGTAGTIGGGAVEHQAIGIARDMLETGRRTAELSCPLGPEIDQCDLEAKPARSPIASTVRWESSGSTRSRLASSTR